MMPFTEIELYCEDSKCFYMLDAYYLYNNDIIPLVPARSQSYSLNQTLTLSYIKSEIFLKNPLFAARAAPISRNVYVMCMFS